jgi:1,4-dihydroxy-2-naphthoate octaprenyltransferase
LMGCCPPFTRSHVGGIAPFTRHSLRLLVMNPLNAWILASRPRTLTAAIVPVIVGSGLAWHMDTFRWLPALAALLAAIFIQIGTNFANDLFDYLKGADTEARLGPTRVTSAGLLSPTAVRNGMIVAFAIAALLGLYLVYVAGVPILIIGIASILSGIAYTGGPFPLGYNGLGDVFVFLFFGFVAVAGTYFVQALTVIPEAFIAALPVGALATAILVVNNVRDADTDKVAGKRTLAVLLGRGAGRAEYLLLMILTYVTPFILWLGYSFSPWVILPLLTIPLAVRYTQNVYTATDGPTLNRTLGGTAQLLAQYGVLFTIGLVL